ncbi:MAG: NADH:flavin oxidoreductase/NADH oxidase [Proteobacteria bacterium]|nr:NADH:flavin oxidoreductase/NADH oxidase [Pseudomonadota bacterium]
MPPNGGDTPLLFSPIRFRDTVLRNRIVVSPMCQYSAVDGVANDWHLVHLGRLALGGAGLVFTEQTAVTPEGRITHGDLGLWSDSQIAPLKRITAFIEDQGAVPGIQLGHAGRKGSRGLPWHDYQPLRPGDPDGEPWRTVGPTDEPAGDGWPAPSALSVHEIQEIVIAYGRAAARAAHAGYRAIEVHGAHGYLVHAFLSPISNTRSDLYGGDRAGRMRLALEIAETVRANWPSANPFLYRLSIVDAHGEAGIKGWNVEDSCVLARELAARGVDAIDCSSGGVAVAARSTMRPPSFGSQVRYAEAVRRETGIPTVGLGLIRDPHDAEAILRAGNADLIAVAREMLADPNWALHAARALGADPDFALWPRQYGPWLAKRERELTGLTGLK